MDDDMGQRQDEEAHRLALMALVERIRRGTTTDADADRVAYELHLTDARPDYEVAA